MKYNYVFVNVLTDQRISAPCPPPIRFHFRLIFISNQNQLPTRLVRSTLLPTRFRSPTNWASNQTKLQLIQTPNQRGPPIISPNTFTAVSLTSPLSQRVLGSQSSDPSGVTQSWLGTLTLGRSIQQSDDSTYPRGNSGSDSLETPLYATPETAKDLRIVW